MKKRTILLLIFGSVTLFIALLSGYTLWNTLDPKHTCISCHEIIPSFQRWTESAHADIRCTECHGTALSEGYHSLKEKSNMVLSHFSGTIHNEDIRLTEKQILDISERCISCHRDEGAKWQGGNHAATYQDIFMDSIHNGIEPPYADCFRCHGMYYDNDITTLIDFSKGNSQLSFKDQKAANNHTIPCLACHQVHTPNLPQGKAGHGFMENNRNPKVGLYIRTEKIFMRNDQLPRVQITHNGKNVTVAEDGSTWTCIQCHAPNAWHEAGTNDDCTPVGKFEGTSCIECHDPHSTRIRHDAIKRYSIPERNTGKCFSSSNSDVCSVVPQANN